MTKYIIKKHDRNDLLDKLFKENQNNYLIGDDLLSLTTFKHKFINDINLFDIYSALKNCSLNVFKPLMKDIGFLRELKSALEEIEAYNIDIDSLDISLELKSILKALPKYNYSKLYNFIETHDLSDYHIIDSSYTYLDNFIIQKMINSNAKFIKKTNPKHQAYRFEKISERQEIEAIIQHIINKGLDLNDVAIIALNGNNKLIRSLLKRYGIPHHFLNDERVNPYSYKLISLIDFYLDQSLENYLNVIKNNIFCDCSQEIITYLSKHYGLNDDLFKEFNKFKNEDLYYQKLEERASIVHNTVYPNLKKLIDTPTLKKAIIMAYGFIFDNSEDIFILKKYLEENADYINIDNYFIIKEEILNLPIKTHEVGIKIASLFDGVRAKYLFILDASQSNYPQFSSLQGLINEKAMLNTTYPSLNDRYSYHPNRLAYINDSNYVYYGLATSNYEGKANELANDIENIEPIDLPLIEKENFFNSNHVLSKDSAKKLFLKDDILYSSVSALETYSSCHYAYFLKYGLGLFDDRTFEVNPASIGTIIHYLFEKLVTQLKKDYTKATIQEIENLINPFFERFNNLFPNDINKHLAIKEKLIHAFKLELEYLDDMEKDTDFVPTYSEYKFDIPFNSKVHLKGSIDRIDKFDQYYRVIDFKTSKHSLSKNNLGNGSQLQLITYLLIFEKLNGLIPTGAYYLNVQHPKLSIDDYKYYSSGLTESSKDYNDEFNKEHKLKGMTLNDIEELDYNSEYISARSNKNNKLDHDEVAFAFNEIYNYIYEQLSSGDISLKPTEEACKYCSFKRLCHYRGGKYYQRETIYDFNVKEED